jgi:DNA repair photolyase
LDDNFVENLRIISNEMKNNNNIIIFSTSIPCFDSSSKWEPKVPKVEKRIDTLRRISDTGIDSMVAVRPLIPNIEKSEIDKIIESTSPYVFGYYSGPLYMKDFDNELLQRDELEELGCTFEEIEPNWMPKGNKFIKIENPELMAYLQDKVKSFGKEFFAGAAQGIEFLRKNRNA